MQQSVLNAKADEKRSLDLLQQQRNRSTQPVVDTSRILAFINPGCTKVGQGPTFAATSASRGCKSCAEKRAAKIAAKPAPFK